MNPWIIDNDIEPINTRQGDEGNQINVSSNTGRWNSINACINFYSLMIVINKFAWKYENLRLYVLNNLIKAQSPCCGV